MALHTIELCTGVGMLGEGLRAGLAHLGLQTRTVCYVEREAYAAAVLVARQQEGSLDAAPVWSDMLTFNGRRFRGHVDGIVAGFPCQDLSIAGKRAGLDGARSGLFFRVVDIADDCGAWFLFLENVTGIATATATAVDEAEGALEERAAARVLGELADRGWHAEWVTLSASDVGASHGRARWFCLAWRIEMDNPTGPRRHRAGERSAANKEGGQCVLGARCKDLAHTGLQHQHLQQRADGAEHPGESRAMAHTQCAERRPQRVSGAGGIQGHDGCWGEKDRRAGIADSVLGKPHQQRQQQPHNADGPQPWIDTQPCAGRPSVKLAHTHHPRQQGGGGLQ